LVEEKGIELFFESYFNIAVDVNFLILFWNSNNFTSVLFFQLVFFYLFFLLFIIFLNFNQAIIQ